MIGAHGSAAWLESAARSWTFSSTRASSSSPATASPSRPASPPRTVDEAVAAADEIGYPFVVKAQVQIGGRGKAGGIKVANDARRGPRARDERSSAWTSAATRSTRCGSRRRPTSRASTTRRSSSTARPRRRWSCSPRRAAWTSRQVAESDPGRDRHAARRPAGRLPGLPRPPAGLRGRRRRRRRAPGRRAARQALRRVRRRGGDARRGQPADRHARPRGHARSTRRSRSTTTRSSATPTTPRCATLGDEDPQEQMAKERGLTYVKLDGDIGILGNGAGPRHVHARRRRPGRRRAGELPRRRRRLEGRGDRQRGRGDPLQPRRSRPSCSTSSAASRAATRSRKGSSRPSTSSSRRCRSSSAWTAPTTSRAAQLLAEADLPNVHTEATMDGAAAQGRRAGRGEAS